MNIRRRVNDVMMHDHGVKDVNGNVIVSFADPSTGECCFCDRSAPERTATVLEKHRGIVVVDAGKRCE